MPLHTAAAVSCCKTLLLSFLNYTFHTLFEVGVYICKQHHLSKLLWLLYGKGRENEEVDRAESLFGENTFAVFLSPLPVTCTYLLAGFVGYNNHHENYTFLEIYIMPITLIRA